MIKQFSFPLVRIILSLLLLFYLSGCSQKEIAAYKGPVFPPSDQVKVVFLPEQVGVDCQVFAHLLITIPAGKSGSEIEQIITNEAGLRGADLILVGQGRQNEPDAEFEIRYYGPDQQYLCHEQWCGWKFGYDVWEKLGRWISIGFKEWGNSSRIFDQALTLQVAFLRCR